jgi:hypothetical protein
VADHEVDLVGKWMMDCWPGGQSRGGSWTVDDGLVDWWSK